MTTGGVLGEVRQLDIADAIERILCGGGLGDGRPMGNIATLCAAARERQGGPPALLAANRLRQVVRPGDRVVIATGFHVPGLLPHGETDGPPGAAALARAVSLGLHARPLLLGEEATLGPIKAACNAIGLLEETMMAEPAKEASFALEAFPCDELAEGRAEELLQWLSPRAIVVIEKPGLNAKGVAHRCGGQSIEGGRARIEVLVSRARAAGIPTIAVGDRGNESGMGALADVVRACEPRGRLCLCPCEGGIASVDEADIAVVGAVSNWATYGIVACLAVALGKDRLLHDGEAELRMIEACLQAGAVDGISCDASFQVDGLPASVSAEVVEALRSVVARGMGSSLRQSCP
ncbi:MAG: glutamate cyclase domain-containing protein [Chloroflexota bacterium]